MVDIAITGRGPLTLIIVPKNVKIHLELDSEEVLRPILEQ